MGLRSVSSHTYPVLKADGHSHIVQVTLVFVFVDAAEGKLTVGVGERGCRSEGDTNLLRVEQTKTEGVVSHGRDKTASGSRICSNIIVNRYSSIPMTIRTIGQIGGTNPSIKMLSGSA